MPGYSEIPLAINLWKVGPLIANSHADYIHVATEGPLGLAARRFLTKNTLRFSTSFHTRFPEYVNKRLSFISVSRGYRFMRWFHDPSSRIMVTTPSMEDDLKQYGFQNMTVWGRGVDTELFQPDGKTVANRQHPVFLYVGRVAVEKSIEEFLALDLPARSRLRFSALVLRGSAKSSASSKASVAP